MSRALGVVVILGLAGGALCGCGGSSAKSSSPNPTTTTSTGRATIPADDAVAATAAVSLADVGAGFTGYRKAAGAGAIRATSCAVTAPGAFLTKDDRAYSGPMFKKKDSAYFAYSDVYVFRTEALAERFTALRATPAFKTCKQKQDDE